MPVLPNARHEAFSQALAKGQSADEAYQAAGYKANRGNATRMKANESICQRVDELLGKAAEKTLVTIESITDELELARAHAMSDPKGASAAVAAAMGKAKLHGLIVDKQEHGGPNGGPIPITEVRRTIVDPVKPSATE